MQAQKIPIARRTVGYGTADAVVHSDVPTLISSTVKTLPPTTRVGHEVNKGDLLLELDDVDFQQKVIRAGLALETAKAERSLLIVERDAAEQRSELANKDRALALSELDRVRNAFERGAAKQREVDIALQKSNTTETASVNAEELANRFPPREEQADASIASQTAELVLAQENLRRCKVLSPIHGVIQEIDVRVGEHVGNGKRIARIVDSSTLEIPLRLPSYARAHVNLYDPVLLRSAGFGKRYWSAKVSRIAPEDDSQSRTMVVFVDVDQNPTSSRRIPPGLFLRGEVENASAIVPRWVVPRRALRDDRVLVVRDEILRSLPVVVEYSITGEIDTLGLPDQDWAILETPLQDGDLVVVDPGGSLRDGMSVRTILAVEIITE